MDTSIEDEVHDFLSQLHLDEDDCEACAMNFTIPLPNLGVYIEKNKVR